MLCEATRQTDSNQKFPLDTTSAQSHKSKNGIVSVTVSHYSNVNKICSSWEKTGKTSIKAGPAFLDNLKV